MTGSFVAYFVVALLLGRAALPAIEMWIGAGIGSMPWLITGKTLLLDAEGTPVSAPPTGVQIATVRVVPEQNVIDRDLAINVLLPASKTASVVYIDVPGWGGASIPLADPESYEEEPLYRRIKLKNVVNLRKQSDTGLAVASRNPAEPPAALPPSGTGGG